GLINPIEYRLPARKLVEGRRRHELTRAGGTAADQKDGKRRDDGLGKLLRYRSSYLRSNASINVATSGKYGAMTVSWYTSKATRPATTFTARPDARRSEPRAYAAQEVCATQRRREEAQREHDQWRLLHGLTARLRNLARSRAPCG
ncbi:MAG: hypothetical protein WBM44_28250, partial [Waterburya sp.]